MPNRSKRKAFGQHFLNDRGVTQRIAAAAFEESQSTDCWNLVEIGPGEGALTFPLIEVFKQGKLTSLQLTLVEKDRDLHPFWDEKIASGLPAQLLKGDFLFVDPEELFSKKSIVVSNLPYSASTEIFFRLIQNENIDRMILMFQKEVADRLSASIPLDSVSDSTPARTSSPKQIGVPTLVAQNEFELTPLLRVRPSSFKPPPRVHSTVLRVQRRKEPLIPSAALKPQAFKKMIDSAFARRRKMIRSGFKPNRFLFQALERSEIDGTHRPENLTWKNWGRLFELFLEESKQA